MSSDIRKIWAEKTESKKKKKKAATERKEDHRLSDLPEELKLRILGCLDAKQAVQTSVLSKTWVSLWTRIHVLDFNHFSFYYRNRDVFYKFVNWVLSRRDRFEKLDSLKFTVYETCTREFLKSVFDYGFSHGVKHLEASIYRRPHGNDSSWPVSPCDSLTSLKLEIDPAMISWELDLGTRSSVLFKNLTVLHLRGARITDDEPFSGFLVLKSLTLNNCYFCKEGDERKILRLRLHALQLSDLTISNCIGVIEGCFELRTPRLRSLEYYRGFILPKHEGLPVLETLVIDFDVFGYTWGMGCEKRMIDDLMSLFSSLPNIKSLKVFSFTILLLSLFPDELAMRGSPFRELKDLTMHFSHLITRPRLFHKPGNGWYNSVKSYLLHDSPQAKFTVNCDEDKLRSTVDPWTKHFWT